MADNPTRDELIAVVDSLLEALDRARAELDRVRAERDRLAAALAWMVRPSEGLQRGLAEVIDTMVGPLVPVPGIAAALAEHDRLVGP